MQASDIRRFRRLLRSFGRATTALLENRACGGGLTLAQCHVLLEIDEAGEVGPGILASRLRLDKSAVSRTVDGLVKLGLISRTTDSTDRRYSLLSLTSAGRRKSQIIHQVNDDAVRGTFNLIPPDRHAEIIESFRELVAATIEAGRQRKAGPGEPCRTSTQRQGAARS
jgi:DNA-binding MarR family transcriptional regulator